MSDNTEAPTTQPETFTINEAEEAFVRDFCPYKGSPDPLVVWKAAWASCSAAVAQRQQVPAEVRKAAVASLLTIDQATWAREELNLIDVERVLRWVAAITAAPSAQPAIEPLLFRDLALELGVSVATLTQTIARRGLGNFSVNMAVPVTVAKAVRDPAFGLVRDASPSAQPRLTVRVQSFPESNGKRNWTALLVRVDPWDGLIGNCGGITIDRGEFWNRVAYEAERAKLLIGERDTEPDVLDYGDDITTPDQWAGEVRGGRPVRERKAAPSAQAEPVARCTRNTPGCSVDHGGVDDYNHNHPYGSPLSNQCDVTAPPTAQAEPVVTLESATRAIAHLSLSNSPGREAEARAMLAERPQGPAARPDALTWYDGAPPFPQDQEWFIAETIRGDRVVLRSMDEGREHKGNYAFKTADETYMKAEIIKRWMQFPDCEYVPPEAEPNAPWLTEAHMLCYDHGIPAGHITERLRSLRNKLAERDKRPLTERQKAVLWFLYGTGTISGVGFDQKPPGVTANYWWRYELAEAFPELRATAKQEQL